MLLTTTTQQRCYWLLPTAHHFYSLLPLWWDHHYWPLLLSSSPQFDALANHLRHYWTPLQWYTLFSTTLGKSIIFSFICQPASQPGRRLPQSSSILDPFPPFFDLVPLLRLSLKWETHHLAINAPIQPDPFPPFFYLLPFLWLSLRHLARNRSPCYECSQCVGRLLLPGLLSAHADFTPSGYVPQFNSYGYHRYVHFTPDEYRRDAWTSEGSFSFFMFTPSQVEAQPFVNTSVIVTELSRQH